MRKLSMIYSVIICVIILNKSGGWCDEEETGEVTVAGMKKTEQEALYSAIQGFVGNSWNGSLLFPDPCGWTPIQGVSCDFMDGFWYVTDLNIGPLHDNSLSCAQNPQFRSQIFNLNNLRSLSFFSCFTSPHHLITLPTQNWDNLAASLVSLEFRSNPSLIGPVPSVFSNLRNLESLVLIENGLTGSLPLSIGNLRQLKRLVMSGNKFNDRIPDSLGNLTELLILDLSRNSLSGYLPFSIGYLNSLLKLDLSNNMFVGNFPGEIGKLKNLTLLDVRNNNFSGGLTRSLEEMSSLEELVLSRNPIGGEIENIDWKKMQNLMILELSNLGLSGEVPSCFSKLKKLRYIGLSNNNLTGSLPLELANMLSLGAIYVNGNNLTGELNFPEAFYRRLGRRFGASSNPNLCYSLGIFSPEQAPSGVNPCKSGISSDPVLKFGMDLTRVENPDMISSLGVSTNGSVWMVLFVEMFIMVSLVWN